MKKYFTVFFDGLFQNILFVICLFLSFKSLIIIFLKAEFYAWSNFESLKGTVEGVWKTCDRLILKRV